QLFGDTTHLPGRYPVDHHLHHCQKERLLTALIPFEQLRRERAAANPRHPQLQRPDSGLHFPSAVAIAVSQALFRTLKGRRLQLLGHSCAEYLVYDTLQQLSHTLVSTKKLVQYRAIYGNLVLGHPLQPPVGFVDQLNHYQEGDGPSYCYAILILEFTPSYRTLLLCGAQSMATVIHQIKATDEVICQNIEQLAMNRSLMAQNILGHLRNL